MAEATVINFTGHPLSDIAKAQIKERACFDDLEFIDLKISIQRKKPIMSQIINTLEPIKDKVNGTAPFFLILPGLPIAGHLILSYVHGISGSFPKVIELLRDPSGIHVLHDIHDLEWYRHTVRNHRR